MGELRERQRFDLLALVWALQVKDPGLLATVVRRLCVSEGPVDEEGFKDAVERTFYRAWIYGSGNFGQVMGDLFGTLARYDLRMRREFTLAIKAIMQAEELIRAISPGLPVVAILAEEAQSLVRDELVDRAEALLHGDLAVAVRPVLALAPTLGQQFIPSLLTATGRDAPWGSTGTEATTTVPITDDASAAIRTRLAFVIGLVGLGVVAALFTLAFFVRPAAELEGLDFLVLFLPVWVAIALIFTLRGWRIEDQRARAVRERRAGRTH
jgi:predicted unusual protein kinase regulating ubiquinone biosynthesis (AarF/ABC1/UbiB family)